MSTNRNNLLDFDTQFVKYGEFHHNFINEIIHIIFVPLIIFTTQILSSKPVFWEFGGIPINPSFIITVVYQLYYFLLFPAAALCYTPVLAAMLWSAWKVTEMPTVIFGITPWYFATGLHLISWIFQVWLYNLQ